MVSVAQIKKSENRLRSQIQIQNTDLNIHYHLKRVKCSTDVQVRNQIQDTGPRPRTQIYVTR